MINKISFNETYDIICHMEDELYQKIPQSFINFIKQNRVANYEVNIDYKKGINNQELQEVTRVLLSLIYRDYLCDKWKREELLKKDKLELKKIEKDKREKYNPDNIFKKYSNIEKNVQEHLGEEYNNNLPIEVKKQNIFQKLLSFVKKLLLH